MKFFLAFAVVIWVVHAATVSDSWNQFKKTHNKIYKSKVEEQVRYKIFQENLRIINEHNAKFEKGETTYKLGINQFTDWTSEEFREFQTFQIPNITYTGVFKPDPNFIAPDSIDWRQKDAVLPVKDQGQCGSCWAFSTTGSLEGQNIIKNKKKISLSEQNLVDCSTQNNGCKGGNMEIAFEYVRDHGISTESAYPYKGRDGTCQQSSRADITVTGHIDVPSTEAALLNAVGSVGPISVGINSAKLQLYHSGILDDASCSKAVDHAVLAVGYGTQGTTKYWIVKNSWGTGWGEQGYFRLVRDKNQQCGLGSWNTYPLIK